MSSCRLTKHGVFTISICQGYYINVKILNKFIEIKNSTDAITNLINRSPLRHFIGIGYLDYHGSLVNIIFTS